MEDGGKGRRKRRGGSILILNWLVFWGNDRVELEMEGFLLVVWFVVDMITDGDANDYVV